MLSQMHEMLLRVQSFYSVSAMLLETGLPSFNTILTVELCLISECKCNNVLVRHLCERGLAVYIL